MRTGISSAYWPRTRPRGSAQSAALLARMDGGQNTPAVTDLISGLVADGVYPLLDLLYVGATNSLANSLLNWAQTSFPLTSVGTITFTANSGWTGDGLTGIFTTTWNPSTAGGNYTQNSAGYGGGILTSRTTAQNYVIIGGSDATHTDFIEPYTTSGNYNYQINSANTIGAASTNAQGSWAVTRLNGTTSNIYKNGVLLANSADVSNGLSNVTYRVLGYNNNGTNANFSADLTSYVWAGGGLTTAQVVAIYNRFHTYLQQVGAPPGN